MPIPDKCWYDANVRYAFHDGSEGHSTKNFHVFKARVQQLIGQKITSFADIPNVANNPLPGHGGLAVNVMESNDESLVKHVTKVKASMTVVNENLDKDELIKED